MKFVFALVAASAGAASAFVTPAANRGAISAMVNSPVAVQGTSTELNGIFSRVFGKSKDTVESATEEEVRSLFYLWNDALQTGDSRIVAKRYAKDAVLLPTVSDTPRTDEALIKDYFDSFLLRKPSGKILESFVKIGEGWAKDSGIYEFTMGDDGSVVKARYSFLYVIENGQWRIAHHHSSVMPEGITVGQDISDQQVRNLFYLWNDALATGDSKAVANRYAKEAVLLPTVSDIPRTDRASIIDYFNNFLKLEPQGEIKESYVVKGANWAKDVGIYEFTLGADGSKVRARYSFVYVFEDGQWKISHHHSSAMPEAGKKEPTAPKITEKEVSKLFNLWNDALATGDPSKVADRYSKNAVLLPTVSDKPRTDYNGIRDYFVDFLKKKPQGVIVAENIMIGDGWAKDGGVYQFTMGADGSVVNARYSFLYVYEDGEWKIAHHHSSAMPEGLLEAAAKVEQLEAQLA